MKIVNIGDVHGRKAVFDIIDREKDADIINLTGDFFSSHEGISEDEQIQVMEGILALKEDFGDKMHIQRGNHDLEAADYHWARCYPNTGYKVKDWFKTHLSEYLKATEWVFVKNNLIFSHAGISKTWFNSLKVNSVEEINNLSPSELFGFTPSLDNPYDSYGDSKTQPCTWIRPQTLMKDILDNRTQIIGHTTFMQIVHIIDDKGNIGKFDKPLECEGKPVSIWCCDTALEQYLVIDDNQFTIKNTKDGREIYSTYAGTIRS